MTRNGALRDKIDAAFERKDTVVLRHNGKEHAFYSPEYMYLCLFGRGKFEFLLDQFNAAHPRPVRKIRRVERSKAFA